jgi:hypothetical protein
MAPIARKLETIIATIETMPPAFVQNESLLSCTALKVDEMDCDVAEPGCVDGVGVLG